MKNGQSKKDSKEVTVIASQRKQAFVRSVLTEACLKAGCKNADDVMLMTAKVASGIRKYQVAAVKAHMTMGTY